MDLKLVAVLLLLVCHCDLGVEACSGGGDSKTTKTTEKVAEVTTTMKGMMTTNSTGRK